MELIFSMKRKPLKCEPPHFESTIDKDVTLPICTISIGNIIAFSSPTELHDTEGDTWGGHVYVCDLDTPWDSHKVTSTDNPISVLEWDLEGKQLLIGTTVGAISVYGQQKYLLNKWECLYTADFPGEHIITAAFFHPGRRIVALEKKTDVPITDRIQILRSTPTLKGFGGVGLGGACAVTASGLVVALAAPAAGDADVGSGDAAALTAAEPLRPAREHVTHAHVAYKNGSLVVACACRGGVVRCCVASVSRAGALALHLQPLPAVYLDDAAGPPSCIAWCLREETDSLVVAAGGALALWKVTERAHAPHKLLAKGLLAGAGGAVGGAGKPSADCFNTVVWQKTAMWGSEGGERALCVASARLPSGAPFALLVTPRHLHLLARDSHHYVCSVPAPSEVGGASQPAGATPPKRANCGPAHHVVACGAALSALGGVAVLVDARAQLHVYKVAQPAADLPAGAAVQHLTGLLEYSMVSGYDCLDVLLTLKPHIIEALYDRVTESFQRQPQQFQQLYFHSWLKLRTALCRCNAMLQSSCSWLTSLQMAWALWAATSPALRPDDRPDAVLLQALLEEHDLDHDKTQSVSTLEGKAEADVLAEVLGPLQVPRRPLARAADIALTALCALAHQHQHQHQHQLQLQHQHQPHGYELWADPAAVCLLRKLLLLRGEDPLRRLLMRLTSAQPVPKQDLIEECAALGGRAGPRVWEALPRCSVSAPHAHALPLPLEYGVEPDALRWNPEPPPYAQCETLNNQPMDSIRYVYLGGGARAARWVQCARCGARALPGPVPHRNPLLKAHDARFHTHCRCGGKWTLFSNIQ